MPPPSHNPSCATTLTMAPQSCSCRFILDGNRVWYDLLNDDNKASLPDDFVTVVHNTVRGRGLEVCGGIVRTRGNYRKNCHVRKSLAEEFPQFPHVFIPDATGRVRQYTTAVQEKKMNLGSETFRCPVSDPSRRSWKPAWMLCCRSFLRSLAIRLMGGVWYSTSSTSPMGMYYDLFIVCRNTINTF